MNSNDYRETDIGTIPSEWEVKPLGELFDIKQGKSLSPKHRKGVNPKPFLRTSNVFWGKIELSILDEMDFTADEVEQLRLMTGDLLVCEGGDIGRTAIWNGQLEECCYQNHLHRLRKKREDLNPHFYMYWMQAAHLVLNLYGGYGNKTTIPNLSQSRLKSFDLPIPTLTEQHTIAAILSKIQQAIEVQEKIIERTKELKMALMTKLFTEGLHCEELKETAIGLMPKSWEVVTVEALGQIVTGTTPPTADPDNFGLKYPFITPVDLGATKYVYRTQRYLSDKGISLSRPLPKDSVLVTCIGSTVGKVGLTFVDDSITNQQINAIICGDSFDPQFIYYALNLKSDYIRSLSTPSPVPILSKGKFAKALVGLPMDKDDQREISTPLAALDAKMEITNKKAVMLKALFKSMLHQLMTGQIRVNNIELTAP